MLSQYYKFLDKELYEFMKKTALIAGNRYYLILNDTEEIVKMEEAIKNSEDRKVKEFKSEEFDFRAIYYAVNAIKVVFVFAKKGMTHDFLVTLRNKVSLQKDEWHNTVIVFMMQEELDSITGGAYNLSKQGAPFHTLSLRNNLKSIVNSNALTKTERSILNFVIENNFSDDLVRYTLMDFEAVYSIIEQDEIKKNDYLELGIFQDDQIDTYPESEVRKRLKANKQLFDTIASYHDRGNPKEHIENEFEGDALVRKLTKDNWYEVDFEKVKKGKERMDKFKKININFLEEDFSNQFKGIKVWDKPSGNTKVKQRERHIIIFKDGNKLDDVKLPFSNDVDINSAHIIKRGMKTLNLTTKTKIDLEITSKSHGRLLLKTSMLNTEHAYYFEFTYKHNKENALTFKFRILIVNFAAEKLSNIKTKYRLKYDQAIKKVEFLIDDVENHLDLSGANNVITQVTESGQSFSYNNANIFDFSSLSNHGDNQIYIILNIDGIDYKIKLNETFYRPTPETSTKLVKHVNENKKSMKFIKNLVTQGTKEFYLYSEMKDILSIEEEMVENKYTSGKIIGDKFKGEYLDLATDIIDNYEELCEIILNKGTLPSIMYFDEEIKKAALTYCESVEGILDNLVDGEKIQDKKVKVIHELGFVKTSNYTYMTALHPLLLRYEIEKTKSVSDQKLDDKILKKYNASNLLPFIVDEENNYYFAEFNENKSRWLEYRPFSRTNKSSSNITSFIIKSRIRDFKQHFKYLFDINPSFSMKTRFLNISDYKMILRGVTEHLVSDFISQRDIAYANPIDVFIDDLENKDLFYEFYNLESLSGLVNLIDVSVPAQLRREYEEEEILETLKQKLNVYIDSKKTVFHLTFFNFNQEPQFSVYNLEELNCSVVKQGLMSTLNQTKIGSEYVSGFGIKGLEEKTSIVKSAIKWNSFAVNKQNKQLNPYKRNEGIVNNITSLLELDLKDIFDKSNWVTFIDPSVDLSYFNDSNYNLYVIHYNDQTSSFNYESITVTNNTLQYEKALKEFLKKVYDNYKYLNTENIIRSFNILNGEWLLSIIGKKSDENLKNNHTVKEKLSIVSAYKNVLSILDGEKIVWVPISLEEILRVSRQQGLDSSSDIFSAKELGHNGSISDDLLFIGMERSKGGKYKFHLIPVEVKVGQNSSQVVSKATEQVKNIYRLIKNELLTASENTFTQDFYRSFFLTLYFGNLKKFIDNGILTDNRFHEIFNLRSKVLNGEIEFTDQINKRYSEGLILLFTQGSSFRKMVKQSQSNIYEVHLTENDAYRDADREYHDIDIEMKKGKKGIDPSSFLSHNMLEEIEEIEEISNVTYDQEYKKRDPDTLPIDDKHKNGNIASSRDIEKEDYKVEEIGPVSKSDTDVRLKADYSINNVRILLGKIKGSNENLYWEYGNHNLPNRHMLISGKSGQGKTYFMQCLLLEMSKNRIDSLIVDYTDGFLNNQLEETFVSRMDEKLKTKFVFVNKLPINPFRRNEIDLGGVLMPETDDDIADRVVQIVDFVFNLGIQQNSLLKEVVKRGLSVYDESLTFSKIKEYLLADDSSLSSNLYGRTSTLLDRDPFDYKNEDFAWSKIFNYNGEVNIIQLKGFASDIQKVITEFLLWDLYNYSQREGNKNHPLPILLDEMQNLNHKESSPTGKILKEGRKFGWSTWLATQSLNSIKNSGGDISALFNAGQQIHFAAPEDQITFISKTLASDTNERKEWENRIVQLNKGECIVNGYAEIGDKLKKIVEIIEVIPLEER